jgi:hypothetical protein
MTRLVALEDQGDVVLLGRQVAVQAVGRDVEDAVLVPADVEVVLGEGDVLDLGRSVIQSSRAAMSRQ